MSNCKVVCHLFNQVFDGEVCATLVAFNLALHTSLNTALGRLKGCAIDQELAFALEVDLLLDVVIVMVARTRGEMTHLMC